MFTIINKLGQPIRITLQNPETGVTYDATLSANATYGPVSRAEISPYTDQLATAGHILIRSITGS